MRAEVQPGGGMAIDFTEVQQNLEYLYRQVLPDTAMRGLRAGAYALLKDAIKEVPKCPFDTGDLAGSDAVEEDEKGGLFGGPVSVIAGFQMPYAAKWHEYPLEASYFVNWTTPGSGPKYLEAKMAAHADRYMTICAEAIKDLLSGR